MNEWLLQARERLAGSMGDEVASYDLAPADVESLLELARIAAHRSEERTNAPLISYLVGLAHGRHPDRRLDELVEQVTESEASTP